MLPFLSLPKPELLDMPKKVLIAMPPTMIEQMDFVASQEHRTRSDLIREALRRYLDSFRKERGLEIPQG